MVEQHRKLDAKASTREWIRDKNPLKRKNKTGQLIDTSQGKGGAHISSSDDVAPQISSPPPPPLSKSVPFDQDGNYTGASYFFDDKTRALQRRTTENHFSNQRDVSYGSSTKVQTGAYLDEEDEEDASKEPSYIPLARRPMITNPDLPMDEMQSKAKVLNDADRLQQLSHIEKWVFGTMKTHPELAGPEDESAEDAIVRILDYYERRSESSKGTQKDMDQPGARRVEEVRAANTSLQDSNKRLTADNNRLQDSNNRLQDKILKMNRDYKELEGRLERDSQTLNGHITGLRFQYSELESSHTAKLQKVQNAKQKELDTLKQLYEDLLRKSREDAAIDKREAQRRQDKDRKTIEELNSKLTSVTRDWGVSYNALDETRKDLEHRLRNAKADEEAAVRETEDKWERKIQKERKDQEDRVRSLESEVTRLNKIIDNERSHKEDELRSQERKLKEKHEEETVGLRTVIEDFKVASSRREHFKGLTDSEMAAQYKRLANNIEDVSRLEWDYLKEQQWPLTDSRMRQLSKNTRKLKQQIVQNTLWLLLYEYVFRSPFRIMGADGREYDIQWTHIYASGASSFDWPETSADAERNRFETAKAFMDAVEPSASDSTSKRSFEDSITAAMNAICRALVKVATVQAKDRKSLEGIVRSAAKVWLESCSQRYRLIVVLPEGGCDILSYTWTDNSSLSLVVRPDVKRYGDSHGKDLMRGEPLAGWKGLTETYLQ